MSDSPAVEPSPVEGRVDGYDSGVIQGWAWYPAQPDAIVALQVLIEGRVVAVGTAAGFRVDLAGAGKRYGRCAFSIPLSVEDAGTPGVVQVTVQSKDGQPLVGGELEVEPVNLSAGLGGSSNEADSTELSPLEGWVDGYDDGVVHGWAWYPLQPASAAALEILVAGRVVAGGVATGFRADLVGSGKRDGRCAFSIPLTAEDIELAGTVQIIVRSKDGQALVRGELTIEPLNRLTTIPVAFDGAMGFDGFIEQFGPDLIIGWISRPADQPSPPVEIELWEAGDRVGAVLADIWRTDIEEARQGDGRWGFAAHVPAGLRDGKTHIIEVCVAGDRRPITRTPLRLRLQPHEFGPLPARYDDGDHSSRTRPMRNDAPADVMFSVIVNFYNMPREAARTLTSLTRTYQQGIGALRYEVLCVDNGSSPPIERGWVEGFGPEFRLIRPVAPAPSPCRAINEAAAQAKGRYLAIMIDGAHVLSPGVFREVWDAVDDTPEVVVALRQWFVGGDQRWLSSAGYTRAQEDILFDKIAWPTDGYRLFKISTPIWESPNHWLDGLIESNCLFVPRETYLRIGGMDEGFDEPGAGYANLDLFKRAVGAVPEPVIAILGEASFHQFHDGTTTNVSDAEKENRVRGYENNYMRLRGAPYFGVPPVDIRQRGQLRVQAAVVGRQRPLSPARLGVTDKVRLGSLPLHFDNMSAANLQSVYVECGLHKLTRWRGHDVMMAPADIVEIQDIVHQVRPERIVTVNVNYGVVVLLDSLLGMMGLDDSRIVRVGEVSATEGPMPPSVDRIGGEPCAAETLRAVEHALDTQENVLVLFAPGNHDYTPIEPLRAYAGFVSVRSYLIVLGSVFGQPWLGYSKFWLESAIKTLVREAPFVIDHSRNQQLVTTSPNGYLQRVLDNVLAGGGDAADDLSDI